MTEIEQAFNDGVAAAASLLRGAADVIPPNYALPPEGLRDLAHEIQGLMVSVDVPEVSA